MVTGRPPFLGDDAVGVISQHINTPPVDPSWHAPECPKPLEALILRLYEADGGDSRRASLALGVVRQEALTGARPFDGLGELHEAGEAWIYVRMPALWRDRRHLGAVWRACGILRVTVILALTDPVKR